MNQSQDTDSSIDSKLSRLETGSVGRLLWSYSLPAVAGMVVTSLYNVIDRVFIGRGVGPDAISGLAITFPLMNLATALGVLIGVGSSSRISILLGAKQHARAARVLGNALTMTIIVAIVYISVFALFLDDILRAFGASDRTLPYAHDFISFLLPGLLMTNLTYSLNNVQRASGYPRRAMVTMMLSALANVILAPIFIFGLDMGIRGAAIATDIAMALAFIFVLVHFLDKKSTLHFEPGTYRPERQIVMSIISIGAAPALVNAAGCLINIIINKSLYYYGGDTAIGAAGIFTTVSSLIAMIIIGICQGMQPIVGYNYGAGHMDRLKRAYWLTVIASSIICTIGWAFSRFFSDIIAEIFTSDAELIKVTARAVQIAMAVFFVVAFQIVSTNFFQSIGKAGKSIFLSLTRQVLFLIPLLLTLPRFFGLEGVWMSFPCSDLVATIVTAAFIFHQFRHMSSLD
jgi:putative MATE family efflux protein